MYCSTVFTECPFIFPTVHAQLLSRLGVLLSSNLPGPATYNLSWEPNRCCEVLGEALKSNTNEKALYPIAIARGQMAFTHRFTHTLMAHHMLQQRYPRFTFAHTQAPTLNYHALYLK